MAQRDFPYISRRNPGRGLSQANGLNQYAIANDSHYWDAREKIVYAKVPKLLLDRSVGTAHPSGSFSVQPIVNRTLSAGVSEVRGTVEDIAVEVAIARAKA